MGHVVVGRAKRPLMAFVMVLSYSRRIFLHFSLNAQMDNFLRGHFLAFEAWGEQEENRSETGLWPRFPWLLSTAMVMRSKRWRIYSNICARAIPHTPW
jgi:hypothetical protein